MRITPEQILRDYEETGLEPIRGLLFGGGKYPTSPRPFPLESACGVGVRIAAIQNLSRGINRYDKIIGSISILHEEYGGEYIGGFTDGFDDIPLALNAHPSLQDSERYWEGKEDGEAAAEAVFSRDRELALA